MHGAGLSRKRSGVKEAVLKNALGERFMKRYDPVRMELSTRDVVSRAIATEIANGRGTPHGGVFLDITHLPREQIETRLPVMLEQFLTFGVDIRTQPMEVAPTAHHIMGGLKITSDCSTTVPGLFACGETSGGVQGANRLGGNALAETQVFGKRAGEFAGQKEKRVKKDRSSTGVTGSEHVSKVSFAGPKTRRGSGRNSSVRCGRARVFSGTNPGLKMRLPRQSASSGHRFRRSPPQVPCGMLYCQEHVPHFATHLPFGPDPARIPGADMRVDIVQELGRGTLALRPHVYLGEPRGHRQARGDRMKDLQVTVLRFDPKKDLAPRPEPYTVQHQ